MDLITCKILGAICPVYLRIGRCVTSSPVIQARADTSDWQDEREDTWGAGKKYDGAVLGRISPQMPDIF